MQSLENIVLLYLFKNYKNVIKLLPYHLQYKRLCCVIDDGLEAAKNNHINCLNNNININDVNICTEAAKRGYLQFLKIAREKYNCKWNWKTIESCTFADDNACLQYALQNNCELIGGGISYAYKFVRHGYLNCLRCLLPLQWADKIINNDLIKEAIIYKQYKIFVFLFQRYKQENVKELLMLAEKYKSKRCKKFLKKQI
jgi:hypothetical protein